MIASARLSSLSIQVKHFPWLVIAPILLGAAFVIALLTWSFYHANQVQQRVDRLTGQQQELLYEQHLQALNQHKLQSEKSSAENRLQELQSDEHQARSKQFNDILSQ